MTKRNKLVIVIGILSVILGAVFGGLLYFLEWDKAMLWEHGKVDYVVQYADIYNYIRDGEAVLMIGGIAVLCLLLVLAVIGLLRYQKLRMIFVVTIIGVFLAPLAMLGYYLLMWVVPVYIAGCLGLALLCFIYKEV